MTNEEAHSILEEFQTEMTTHRQAFSEKFIQAHGNAILALEKQIPKKPIGDLHSVPHHRCPSCRKAVRIYVDAPFNPVCHFCGQTLDWSDEL